jgi:hypothetical protein
MADDYKSEGPRWKPYINREVTLTIGEITYHGVLRAPNFEEKYLDLCPCVMSELNDEGSYFEPTMPIRISLDIIVGNGVMIAGHKNGYLEAKIKNFNELVKKRKQQKMGFGETQGEPKKN